MKVILVVLFALCITLLCCHNKTESTATDTDLKNKNEKILPENEASKDKLRHEKDINFIVGLWSTSWPVSPDISQGYIFNIDETFIYQNDFWSAPDGNNIKFPITRYYGTKGKWKLAETNYIFFRKKMFITHFRPSKNCPVGFGLNRLHIK